VNFVTAALSSSDYGTNCKNGSGVSVTQQNISGSPNGTASTSASASASGSGAAASPSASHTGDAAQAKAVSWVLGAVGLVGLTLL
jgi:nascent polypeptide-associated complex subunit beta